MTYRYEFDESVPVFHLFLDVYSEGCAHHGLEKEIAAWATIRDGGSIWLGGAQGYALFMRIASGRTRWCHGSQPGLLDVMIEVVVGVKVSGAEWQEATGGDLKSPHLAVQAYVTETYHHHQRSCRIVESSV